MTTIPPGADMGTVKLERVLSTAAQLLIEMGQVTAASVVINGKPVVRLTESQTWNGEDSYHWTVLLGLPAASLTALSDTHELQTQINDAFSIICRKFPDQTLRCEIGVDLDETNLDWRLLARQRLAGEGVTNQGRVRSNNISRPRFMRDCYSALIRRYYFITHSRRMEGYRLHHLLPSWQATSFRTGESDLSQTSFCSVEVSHLS